MLNVGVVGFGYWGPNIVRNVMSINSLNLKAVCDVNPATLKNFESQYPHIQTYASYEKLIQSKNIDIVAVITPVSSHYAITKLALEAGKHVFVEKPFTATVREAEELVLLAEKNKCCVMVDHTFIYTGAVRKIKNLIESGDMGELNYYDSTRVSLGLFQHDVNVIWDLAPHDFSIIDYVINSKPKTLIAQGADHVGRGMENLAYITMNYENNLMVHINVNWLSPVKVRSTLIGGQKKMLVWDDLQADEKIKIYDRGVDINEKTDIYRLKVDYRSGDMWSPKIEHKEALRSELECFVDCIKNNKVPANDAHAGLRIVRLLENANQSLKGGGKLIKI